jgi:hypothetical protein
MSDPRPAPFIKCLHCGKKSCHPKDIEERFCGQCHAFHDVNDENVTHEIGLAPDPNLPTSN